VIRYKVIEVSYIVVEWRAPDRLRQQLYNLFLCGLREMLLVRNNCLQNLLTVHFGDIICPGGFCLGDYVQKDFVLDWETRNMRLILTPYGKKAHACVLRIFVVNTRR